MSLYLYCRPGKQFENLLVTLKNFNVSHPIFDLEFVLAMQEALI